MRSKLSASLGVLLFLVSATCFASTGLASTGLASPCAAEAGQRARVEVPKGQTATGKTSDNASSTVSVNVAGHALATIEPKQGDSSKDIVDKLVKALTDKGYKVTRDGDHAFFIDEAPGGKAVGKGGGIGTTDTGLNGLRLKIVSDAPGLKKNGGAVPKPKAKQPNARASKKGHVQIDATVEQIINGKKVLVPVQVVVPIEIGDSEADIEKRAKDSLRKGGHEPRDVELPSNLDGRTLIPCLGLDRMQNGDPILELHIDVLMPPEFLMPLELFVGMTPVLGITNEGSGSQPREPWIYGSDPYLGQPWRVYVEVGDPNVFGGLFLSPQPALIPIQSLGPDAFWLIDPLPQIFLPLPPPIAGQLGRQFLLPPDPQLQGADLMLQSLVLDTKSLTFATTDRLVVHPMMPKR